MITLYTDGASRGNPGKASIGAIALDKDGTEIFTLSECIGVQTNNYAEYEAVAAGLAEIVRKKLDTQPVEVRLDSELVTKQLNGEYRVKEEGLFPSFIRIHNLRVAMRNKPTFVHVYREQNTQADALANQALDNA